MPQSLSNVLVHIVFSTKDRRPFLKDETIQEGMHGYLGATSNTLKCPPVVVGGVEDHVHLLARQARTIALAEWVKELKRVTSIWIKEQDSKRRNPVGAVVFCVSPFPRVAGATLGYVAKPLRGSIALKSQGRVIIQ